MFVTHDRDIICFLGDSYANCGSGIMEWYDPLWMGRQLSLTKYPVYTDLLADRLGMRSLVLGFGGASWWQTRAGLTKFFAQFPEEKSYIKKIVMMHTGSIRVNSVFCNDASDPREIMRGWYDAEFNDWCQCQWFREIPQEIFPDITAIHFSCNGYPVMPGQAQDYALHLLNGVVFRNPLLQLTVGEFAGTRKQTDQFLASSSDSGPKRHHNHLNRDNHAVLTDILYETFSLYRPGIKDLPLDRFYRPNSNNGNWPLGQYWLID